MNKLIYIIIALALVLGGVFLFMNKSAAPAEVEVEDSGEQVTTELEDSGTEEPASDVKEFSISGTNFTFAPKNIRVAVGDRVRITFTNTQGMHDLLIDPLGLATKVLSAGQSETIEFTATTKGSFEYYCSVGTHKAMGMTGTLIVE